MLMKEACRASGLTKKAVEYYEKHGLVQPTQLANGYRDYSPADVARLKEIAVLRQCGLNREEIRAVSQSANKPVALARYRYLHALQQQKWQLAQTCLERLTQEYDIESCWQALQQQETACYTIRERLVLAFPGNYGVYISLHFGRFLEFTMETPEQQEAYAQILHYLDAVPMAMPAELDQFLSEIFANITPENMATLQENVAFALAEARQDLDAYVAQNQLEDYLAYRLSPEFGQSPQGKMMALMQQFQKNSGYQEIFLANLKLLSPAYRKYCLQLEEMNEQLLSRYPQAKELYRQ